MMPFGGSPGTHKGRFSKRMFQLNSRHRYEAMDTKLDVFLRISILGAFGRVYTAPLTFEFHIGTNLKR